MNSFESTSHELYCQSSEQPDPRGLAFSDCFDDDKPAPEKNTTGISTDRFDDDKPAPRKNKLDWLPNVSRTGEKTEEILRAMTEALLTAQLVRPHPLMPVKPIPGEPIIPATVTPQGKLSEFGKSTFSYPAPNCNILAGTIVRALEYEDKNFDLKEPHIEPQQTRDEFAADGKTRKNTMGYDPEGKLIARTEFSADGRTPTSRFDFMPQQKLWLQTEFATDGKTPSKYSLFNTAGDKMQSKIMQLDGKTTKSRIWYSVKDGEPLEQVDYWASGKLKAEVSYSSDKTWGRVEYDSNGRKSKVVGYHENGTIGTEITFYENGLMKDEAYYHSDGRKSLHVSNDKDGNSVRTEYEDSKPARSFAYDKKSRLNGEWTYHDNGRIKSLSLYNAQGTKQQIEIDAIK